MASEDWIAKAEDLRPSEAMMQGISALILAIFGAMIMLMEELAAGISRLFDVLGAVRNFFIAFLEAPIIILEDTARFVVFTLTQGEWAFFGPLTFPVGVAVIGIAFWTWAVLDPPIPLPGFLGRIVNRNREDD